MTDDKDWTDVYDHSNAKAAIDGMIASKRIKSEDVQAGLAYTGKMIEDLQAQRAKIDEQLFALRARPVDFRKSTGSSTPRKTTPEGEASRKLGISLRWAVEKKEISKTDAEEIRAVKDSKGAEAAMSQFEKRKAAHQK